MKKFVILAVLFLSLASFAMAYDQEDIDAMEATLTWLGIDLQFSEEFLEEIEDHGFDVENAQDIIEETIELYEYAVEEFEDGEYDDVEEILKVIEELDEEFAEEMEENFLLFGVTEGETVTINIDGKDYEVEGSYISIDDLQAKVVVNADSTDMLDVGESDILSDGSLIYLYMIYEIDNTESALLVFADAEEIVEEVVEEAVEEEMEDSLGPVEIEYIYVDGDKILYGEDIEITRGEHFDIEVQIEAQEDLEDVRIEVSFSGDDLGYGIISEEHDLDEGDEISELFYMNVPDDGEEDEYLINIMVASEKEVLAEYDIEVEVEAKKHDLMIKDIDFSADYVIAGETIKATVDLANMGRSDEEDVVVELYLVDHQDITDSIRIKEIEEGEKITTDELSIKIPEHFKKGKYEIGARVYYNDIINHAPTEYYTLLEEDVDSDNLMIHEDIGDYEYRSSNTIFWLWDALYLGGANYVAEDGYFTVEYTVYESAEKRSEYLASSIDNMEEIDHKGSKILTSEDRTIWAHGDGIVRIFHYEKELPEELADAYLEKYPAKVIEDKRVEVVKLMDYAMEHTFLKNLGEGAWFCADMPIDGEIYSVSVYKYLYDWGEEPETRTSIYMNDDRCWSYYDFSLRFESFESFKDIMSGSTIEKMKDGDGYVVLPSIYIEKGFELKNVDSKFEDRFCPVVKEVMSPLTAAVIGLAQCFDEEPALEPGFDAATTKLSEISDLEKVDNLILEKRDHGKIDFSGVELDLSDTKDLAKYIKIEPGLISVNTFALEELKNKPAKLTMRGLELQNPVIYMDGKECGDVCSDIDYDDGTLTFKVKHFTTFTVQEDLGEVKVASARIVEEFVEAGDEIQTRVSMENVGGTEIDDIKVTVVIPELGVRKQVKVNSLDDEEIGKTIVAELDEDTPEGEYAVRITVSNDDFRRVKHRFITVG